jgi:hypothetical protein
LCGFHHGRRAIDSKHFRSARDNLGRQRAIAAAEIEDAFTGMWRKQIQNAASEIGDEPPLLCILCRIPTL